MGAAADGGVAAGVGLGAGVDPGAGVDAAPAGVDWSSASSARALESFSIRSIVSACLGGERGGDVRAGVDVDVDGWSDRTTAPGSREAPSDAPPSSPPPALRLAAGGAAAGGGGGLAPRRARAPDAADGWPGGRGGGLYPRRRLSLRKASTQ